MGHYPQFIRLFDSAVGYTTEVREAWYINWLKQSFKWTIKQNGFEIQILYHNIRKLNMLAQEDNFAHDSSYWVTQVDFVFWCMVNHVSRAKTLSELHWKLDLDELEYLQESYFSKKIVYYSSTTAQDIEIPDFVDVLTVFIRQ